AASGEGALHAKHGLRSGGVHFPAGVDERGGKCRRHVLLEGGAGERLRINRFAGGRRKFDSDGGGGDAVHGAQRGCHCPGRNLLLLQGGGERGGPVGAAFRKRRLRALPGNHSRSGGWIVVVGGKQRRIDAHAGAAGRGVNGDVEHRSRGVGRVGALVGGERAVG